MAPRGAGWHGAGEWTLPRRLGYAWRQPQQPCHCQEVHHELTPRTSPRHSRCDRGGRACRLSPRHTLRTRASPPSALVIAGRYTRSFPPDPLPAIPAATVAAVRAAFPKGNLYVDLRAEFGTLYADQLFTDLYPPE